MTIVVGPRLGVIRSGAEGENWYPESQALFRLIEALMMGAVADKDLAAPPGSPADGDMYIVAASPTGAWTGHAKAIAYWDATAAAWYFYTPLEGFSVWVVDEAVTYRYTGAAWSVNTAGNASQLQGHPASDFVLDGDAAGGDLSGTYPNPSIVARAVTFAKAVAIATARILGRSTAGSGDIEELTPSAARSVMGLGTSATLDVDTDNTLAANSDTKLPSQKAVKDYVASTLDGRAWKQPVRFRTTANVNLSGGGLAAGTTHDGVTAVAGDRALVMSQTAGAENGLYLVPASGAASRASDADVAAEILNATMMVEEGTSYADTQWTCSTNAPITLGTTALVFIQSGAASTDVADETTLHKAGNTFSVNAGGVGTTELAARGTTFAKIVAIATAKLLGRGTAGSGDIEEIAIGSGLSLSAGTLSAPGSGGGTGPGNAAITTKTANYTATSSDYTILCDASGGAFTIALPAAASNNGMILVVKKTDTSINLVTVDANASETIDGALTYALGVQHEKVQIQSNGTNWVVLARYVPSMYLRAKLTGNTTMTNATWTVIAFAGEDDDTHTQHDTVTNNSRFVCKRAGLYAYSCMVGTVANGIGMRAIRLVRNNTTTLDSFMMMPSATYDWRLRLAGHIKLAVGDYVELQIYQDAGGSLNTVVTPDETSHFEWVLMEPTT